MTSSPLWAMILAGGEGLRLRSFTRSIAGDDRPKQFCPVLGDETLLERTRRRAALLTGPDRTTIVLTRAHERFYAPLVTDVPARCRVVQPENRGTAPAILYGLFRIAVVAPMATVVILPCDHYVSDEIRFARHVGQAHAAVDRRPDIVALLGVFASSAEPDYGWIEPGEPLPGSPLRRVGRFWEKPTEDLARILLQRGCLWNTLVIVARVPTLLAMIRIVSRQLHEPFAAVPAVIGTLAERAAVERVYGLLAPACFSATVLAAKPANLTVLPVAGVEWSDLGNPQRVMATLADPAARLGTR